MQEIRRAIPEPVAIVGFAFQFPQGAIDEESLWEKLMNKECTSTEFPSDRLNIEAFHSPDVKRQGTIRPKRAHFLGDDIRKFDAQFFGIPPAEAACLDPQQRGLLETTYHAIENAGIRRSDIAGSNTSVHVGSFCNDYMTFVLRDEQQIPTYNATGCSQTLLSNRISWAFDLRGTSLTIDTACSSGLVALDLACQEIWTGRSSTAICAASNIIFSPENLITLSNMNFLSPDGKCFSFDHRGNGYAKGEGFASLILKPLSQALEDGNKIRCLIRSTGSNQDGRTAGGITQPSKQAQKDLIAETYKAARLDLCQTRLFEAHGTGTAIGDPIEAAAIGETFRRFRSDGDPIYVGAAKSNFGHLEGASGLLGVIKTVLAIERGVIPPNTNFEKLNADIDDTFFHLKFPTEWAPWPDTASGIRRASVNSFGYGGTNAHVVLDDVQSYLKERGLSGHHGVRIAPRLTSPDSWHHVDHYTNGCETDRKAPRPRLLVFSAFDEQGIQRQLAAHREAIARLADDGLDDYAYALACRRDALPWKTISILTSPSEVQDKPLFLSAKPHRSARSNPTLCFVFTGQGAQWHGMGQQLLTCSVFRDSLIRSQHQLERLGWTSSLINILSDSDLAPLLDRAQYSQVVTTCIQIALVELFRWLRLSPSVVVGHSSGEIAAAYCAGYLDHSSALKVSYYRGLLSSSLEEETSVRHTMAAVGLSVDDALAEMAEFKKAQKDESFGSFTVSCINSPRSVTISGPVDALSAFTNYLAAKKIFTRLLKVKVGYHSSQMSRIASQYAKSMGLLRPGSLSRRTAMVSSVTGTVTDENQVCHSDYWVRNMVSTVDFLAAIQFCCKERRSQDMKNLDGSHAEQICVDVWLEIGPHSALYGPVKQIVQSNQPPNPVQYHSALVRNMSALSTLLNAIGCLWLENVSLDMRKVTSLSCPSGHILRTPPSMPAYPFNHSVTYWEESQANLDFRLRKHASHDLAGTRFGDLRSKVEAEWRFRIKVENMPWVQDHKIQGSIVYPAAGSIAMVIEAAKQLLGGPNLTSLELKNVEFAAPIHVSSKYDTQLVLHLSAKLPKVIAHVQYNFRIFSSTSEAGHQTLVCSGSIRGNIDDATSDFQTGQQELQDLQSLFLDAKKKGGDTIDSEQLYESMRTIGLEYGPAFQSLANISSGVEGQALATSLPLPIEVSRLMSSKFTVHPSRLDGLFQLGFAAMAGNDSIRGMVPTRIGRLYVPVAGFGHIIERRETAHCQAVQATERNTYFSITLFDEATLELKAYVEDLELTTLSMPSVERKHLEDAPSVCQQLQWKPDLATMSTDEIIAHCQSHELGRVDLGWIEVLHSLTLSYATLALQSMRIREEACGSSLIKPSMKDYAEWLSKQVDISAVVDPRNLSDLIDTLPSSPVIDSYVTIGRNLSAILSGDMHLSELLPRELDTAKLFQILNREIGASRDPLATYIDCLIHRHPNLHLCEIGARLGTAAASILDFHTDGVTARRCAGYTIADIDESVLEYTRQQLSGKQEVDFKLIDPSLKLSAQDFNPQSLDIVIINWTSDFPHNPDFFENFITLLKPNGKLIMREMPKANLLCGFLLGLSPNWTSGLDAPVFTMPLFSDMPLVQSEVSTTIPRWNITVYHKQESKHTELSPENLILIVDHYSTLQRDIGSQLCKSKGTLNPSSILSLSDVASLPNKTSYDFILLVELEKPLLSNISQEDFAALKEILREARSVLWVKKANDIPDYALNEGLLRVSRQENELTAVASLSLETEGRSPASIASRIHIVFTELQQGWSISRDEYEPEYREHNGVLYIPRVIQAREHDKHIFSSTEKPLVHQTIGDKKLRLTSGTLGVLDMLEFVQDDSTKTNLPADQVEVEVRAVGVNFKDLMGLLGRAPSRDLGSEFSGVVTAIGESVKNVTPGDRVVVAYVDAYRTHARAPWEVVHRIPDDVSFEDAASIPTVFRTAYFCLYHLARLQRNESILIHRASGGTGQAAIQLAQMIGATIYVTVGSETKKQLLIDRYGIPEQHILHSRSTSFASGIKRLTRGRGVDVVLNSLSGELLEASWDSVAPFGRFIELGLGDAYARQQLPMFNFSKGVSFMSFNLANFMNPEFFAMHTPLMKSVWNLLTEKKIRPPYPLQLFPVGKIEEAFRLLNSGDSSGKIVIEMNRTSIIPTVAPYISTFQFDPNATYVVTGGLGGIGLKIAQWLCSKGAMNLILVSRSGLSQNYEAQELVSTLTANGVRVECPAINIAHRDAMEAYFVECQRTMPPIKGCVQSAMVLRDATLANMTVEDWHQALAPKVKGTWNLHELLPSMDFFILLSSVVGVGGNRGQANYAAGNTFEDEFARWRTTKHQSKTVSLDLGFVVDAGIMAENDALVNQFLRRKVVRPNRLVEIFALFERICNPAIPITTAEQSQIITGLKLPSETISEGAEVPPELVLPLFRICRQIQADSTIVSPGASSQSFKSLFMGATSTEESASITAAALQAKLAQVLGLRVEEVELRRPLSQYGMDSLVALEIQSWIRREVEAEIAVFEVLGEATVESLAGVVVANSKLVGK